MNYVPKYGELGKDVGIVGRWVRLITGLLALLIGFSILSTVPLEVAAETVFYFALITIAYVAAYYFFGEKIFAKAGPIMNTILLVVPAVLILYWDFLIFPYTGIVIPRILQLAMLFYIGISLILSWKIKYGGCEVVSIPSIILGKKYTTYCVALIPIDYVEKKVVDHLDEKSQLKKENEKMEVELLHNNECHIWKEALNVLNETLKEKRIETDVKLTLIENDEEATKRRFSGSPQVNINGKDVDPMAENMTRFMLLGCRQYFYNGKHFEFPPKEMLEVAIGKVK